MGTLELLFEIGVVAFDMLGEAFSAPDEFGSVVEFRRVSGMTEVVTFDMFGGMAGTMPYVCGKAYFPNQYMDNIATLHNKTFTRDFFFPSWPE
jgi:hypothetical protein